MDGPLLRKSSFSALISRCSLQKHVRQIQRCGDWLYLVPVRRNSQLDLPVEVVAVDAHHLHSCLRVDGGWWRHVLVLALEPNQAYKRRQLSSCCC